MGGMPALRRHGDTRTRRSRHKINPRLVAAPRSEHVMFRSLNPARRWAAATPIACATAACAVPALARPLEWIQQPGPTPGQRHLHGMVYDAAAQVTVVFGGTGLIVRMADTWKSEGLQWVDLHVAGPEPRFGFGMAYDSA